MADVFLFGDFLHLWAAISAGLFFCPLVCATNSNGSMLMVSQHPMLGHH